MKKFILFLTIITLVSGCKREPATWDVDGVIPIFHSRITLDQAIPKENLEIDSNDVLNLVYKGSLFHFKLDTLVSLPDTTMVDQFTLPIGSINVNPGQTIYSDSNYIRYDLNGARVVLLDIESGTITFTVTSSIQGKCILEYSIPTATKNGQPFIIQENIPAGSKTNPASITKTYDVSDYEFSMTGANDNEFNTISTTYRIILDPTENPVTINRGDKFEIQNTMDGITPNYVRGYLGSEVNTSQGEETIDVFNQLKGGVLDLNSSEISFKVVNEVGMDLSVTINEIYGTNEFNQTTVVLNSPLSNNQMNLNRAMETSPGNPPVVPTSIEFNLTDSNSNTTAFISNMPTLLGYDMELHLNPLGNVSNTNDFLYVNTGIDIAMDAVIPFNLSATNVIIVDTADFEMDDVQDETDKVNEAIITVLAENAYPFGLNLQFYMLDENMNVIDSIMQEPQYLPPADSASDGTWVPRESILQTTLDPTTINNLYRTSYMVSYITLNTLRNEKVVIYGSQYVDVKMVGAFNYMVTID